MPGADGNDGRDGGNGGDSRSDRDEAGSREPGGEATLAEAAADRMPFVDTGQALVGGGVAAVAAALAVGTTGVASDAEARVLLESILPTIRFLASAVITASATIMALMLTILSLSRGADKRFRSTHYERVEQVGSWSAWAIVGGTILLLLLSIPMAESEVLRRWYEPIYYLTVIAASLLGGLQVAVILMLRKTIQGMVSALHPGRESSPLIKGDGG